MTLHDFALQRHVARLERQRQMDVDRQKKRTLRGLQAVPPLSEAQSPAPAVEPPHIEPQLQKPSAPKPNDLKLWFAIQRALFSGPKPETQELTVEELSKLLAGGPSGRSLSNALVRLSECYPDRLRRKKDGTGRRLWVFPRGASPPLRRSPFLPGTKNITAP